MGENLDRRAASGGIAGEVVGSAVQSACGAIGQGGNGVAEELTGWVSLHAKNISQMRVGIRVELDPGD
jgi:hypothetical protein